MLIKLFIYRFTCYTIEKSENFVVNLMTMKFFFSKSAACYIYSIHFMTRPATSENRQNSIF